MAKDLPKSSRPTRRKKSETFDHPYQRNIFAPPLASSMREVGAVAKGLVTTFAGLTYAYMSSAQPLADGTALKAQFLGQSRHLAIAFAVTFIVEAMRAMKAFDFERLGKIPQFTLTVFVAVAGAYAVYALVNLPALSLVDHQHRIEEADRKQKERLRLEEEKRKEAAERERLRKEAEDECIAQQKKDVMSKRSGAAYRDHKTCMTDWVKPNLLSNETAEQACAAKKTTSQRLYQELKERQAKDCSTSR